jgi:hypothetical protein
MHTPRCNQRENYITWSDKSQVMLYSSSLEASSPDDNTKKHIKYFVELAREITLNMSTLVAHLFLTNYSVPSC